MVDLLFIVGYLLFFYVMGYDIRFLLILFEKEKFLNVVVDNNYYLFLEYDVYN